jgi:anti-sigma factor (TIGR02949 family)
VSRIDRYTCADVVRRLDEYLDRQLSSIEMQLVREHIATCDVCAREQAFGEATLQMLKAKLRRIDAPADLLARIASTLADANAEEERGRE